MLLLPCDLQMPLLQTGAEGLELHFVQLREQQECVGVDQMKPSLVEVHVQPVSGSWLLLRLRGILWLPC